MVERPPFEENISPVGTSWKCASSLSFCACCFDCSSSLPCSMSVWLVVLVDERLNEGDETGEELENRREHYLPLARSAASPVRVGDGRRNAGILGRRELRAEARRDLDVMPHLLEDRLGLGLVEQAEDGRVGDMNDGEDAEDAEDHCPMGGDEGHGLSWKGFCCLRW